MDFFINRLGLNYNISEKTKMLLSHIIKIIM